MRERWKRMERERERERGTVTSASKNSGNKTQITQCRSLSFSSWQCYSHRHLHCPVCVCVCVRVCVLAPVWDWPPGVTHPQVMAPLGRQRATLLARTLSLSPFFLSLSLPIFSFLSPRLHLPSPLLRPPPRLCLSLTAKGARDAKMQRPTTRFVASDGS